MSDYLCEELIDEILERLPSKSLLRFRSVSKSWRCRISSPSFIRKHAIRSVTATMHKKFFIRETTCYRHDVTYVEKKLLTDEGTRRELEKLSETSCRIAGSCFGIICMHTKIYTGPSVILWNPSIRRKLMVPNYPCRHVYVSIGFGFDSINDDYKIVGLCVHTSFVYSIKTNSWSEIQVPATCRFSEVKSYGYFADGTLHWVARETNNTAHNYILTFNLSTHVFGMISLPKPNCWNNELTIIKDFLALISSYDHETWVWIRREENDYVASLYNACKLKSLEVQNCEGYNPFTGVHYALVNSDYGYKINKDICGETLELLDKEPC